MRRSGHIAGHGADGGRGRLAPLPAFFAIVLLLVHALAPAPLVAASLSPADRLAADLAIHCAPANPAGPVAPGQPAPGRDHCPLCLVHQAAGTAVPPSGSGLPLPPPAVAAFSPPPAFIAAAHLVHSPHSPRAPPSTA